MTMKPPGRSSAPGSRIPLTVSSRSPQPRESRPRTSGRTIHATARVISGELALLHCRLPHYRGGLAERRYGVTLADQEATVDAGPPLGVAWRSIVSPPLTAIVFTLS